MPGGPLQNVMNHLRALVRPRPAEGLTDAHHLERFLAERDETAFAAMVRAHGPMVRGVCRRILGHDAADADDVFQAVFLLLARKGGSIRRREALGSWLYGAALRLACKMRLSNARRQAREKQALNRSCSDPLEDLAWRELRPILDEELDRLPDKYRAAVVLCYLEGKTNEQAARELGCPAGTIKTRLAYARDLLRARLTSRGLALSSAALGTLLTPEVLTAAVPLAMQTITIQAALEFAAGNTAAASALAGPAAAFTERTINAMFWNQIKVLALVLTLSGVVSGAGWLGLRAQSEPAKPPSAETPPAQALAEPPSKDEPDPKPQPKDEKETLRVSALGMAVVAVGPSGDTSEGKHTAPYFSLRMKVENMTGEKITLSKPTVKAAGVDFVGEWNIEFDPEGRRKEGDWILKPHQTAFIYVEGSHGFAVGRELLVEIVLNSLKIEKKTVVRAASGGICTCGCDRSEAMVAELRKQEGRAALQAIDNALATIAEREKLGHLTEPMSAHRLRLQQLAAEIRSGPGLNEKSPARGE